MKLSVQFPLHTKSENELRSLPFVVANVAKAKGGARAMGVAHSIANRAKKQRREVRMFLDSQLPRLRRQLTVLCAEQAATVDNTFRVTMVRISAGVLDDDGLAGALKHVQDEIAAWLGIDDGPRAPVRWQRAQQKGPAKTYAVRIEIEDDDPDPREVHRIVGGPIAKLGPVVGDVRHAQRYSGEPRHGHPAHALEEHARNNGVTVRDGERRVRRAERRLTQAPLIFRRAFYALPEEQHGDEATLHELTRPPFVDGATDPPRMLRVKHNGERITLERRLCGDFPELGEIWLYEVPAPTPRSSVTRHHEQREANRT